MPNPLSRLRKALFLGVTLQPAVCLASVADAKLWGQAQGMSAGVVIAHTVEPILWGMGDMDGGTEHMKPLLGLAGYGVVSTGLFLEKRWGLVAAVAVPAAFWTPHLVVTGTNAVCWSDRETAISGFTIPMMAMETFVAVRSIQLLRRNPAQKDNAGLDWNVGTAGSSVYLHRRF